MQHMQPARSDTYTPEGDQTWKAWEISLDFPNQYISLTHTPFMWVLYTYPA